MAHFMMLADQQIERLSFTAVALSSVKDALARMFASPDQEEVRYLRIGSSNLVMVCACDCKSCEQDQLVNLLSCVQPGRFFVVCLNQGDSEIQAEVSARCLKLATGEHLCSEVVRLTVPAGRIAALPSVIWANSLTGMPAELFWNRSVIDPEILDLFLPLISRIIIDSSRLDEAIPLLQRIIKRDIEVVDLEWLRVSEWRRAIAEIFADDLPSVVLDRLCEVRVITSRCAASSEELAPGLMIAGWLLASMQCHNLCVANDHFVCKCGNRGYFNLRFVEAEEPANQSIAAISFHGADGDQVSLKCEESQLSAVINVGQGRNVCEFPYQIHSSQQLLERFYVLGEGLQDYRQSLKNALSLHK